MDHIFDILRYYLEVEIFHAGTIRIVLKSKKDTVLLDIFYRDVLHVSSECGFYCIHIVLRSIVVVNIEYLKTHEGVIRSLIDVHVMGRSISKPLFGAFGVTYWKSEGTDIKTNFGERPFQYGEGKK